MHRARVILELPPNAAIDADQRRPSGVTRRSVAGIPIAPPLIQVNARRLQASKFAQVQSAPVTGVSVRGSAFMAAQPKDTSS
jgi:hypothetical protein